MCSVVAGGQWFLTGAVLPLRGQLAGPETFLLAGLGGGGITAAEHLTLHKAAPHNRELFGSKM